MTDKKLTDAGISAFTTPTDTDLAYMVDDVGGTPTSKKITWANIKATLKTYFDTLYGAAAWGAITGTLTTQVDLLYAIEPQQGTMRNGKLSVTVATNNLTVALKTLAGNNPSASEPVYVYLGGAWRTVTAALSVTKNAGTNWFNAGGSELATKEIDYFTYIGYNATDGVVIGFSRIPWASIYSEFNTTSTNEKYAAISTITTAAAGDEYAVIGRFAATLSQGAGYTWTVPTFTADNLVQHPIFETHWLTWVPAYSGSGSLTYTSVTSTVAKYRLRGDAILEYEHKSTGTLGGTASTQLLVTLPFQGAQSANSQTIAGALLAVTAVVFGGVYFTAGTPDKLTYIKYDNSNMANSSTGIISSSGFYEV